MDFALPTALTIEWDRIVPAAIVVLAVTALALVLHHILFGTLKKLAQISDTPLDEVIFARLRSPMRWAFVIVAISIATQADPLLMGIWESIAKFAYPAIFGWIAYTIVKAVSFALEYRAQLSTDPVAARSRKTRITLFSRMIAFAIIFVTVGLILLGIPGVREVGVTLMASAGLAALAVGAAAQPALKSLIGGLQMALTEPLRIGDLVVVDGHTGRVEEIRMSFVVVRIWDERAVIVPTTRFFEESFENWSRVSERLSGPVFLHIDPASSIEPIRAEFLRYVAAHDKWDKRSASALLTEAFPESLELRLSMSAATISELWELRCDVREHMLGWLQNNMPDALIRHRLEVDAANARALSDN